MSGTQHGTAGRVTLEERIAKAYSRAELLSDAAVHVVGLVLALCAVPILIALAVLWVGDAPTVIAALVYGVSLVAMIVCSALYHMTPAPDWKDTLRRIDQSAIYVKIAGTYTPFAVYSGAPTAYLLTGVWSAAIAGASLRLLAPERYRWLTIALYLSMGWAVAVVGGPMLAALTPTGYMLILVGGLLYTFGLVFFLWEGLPFHNTIWHVFVLAATSVLYAAVVIELSVRAVA